MEPYGGAVAEITLSTEERVLQLVDLAGLPNPTLDEHFRARLDSLELAQLQLDLEDAFAMEISEEELQKLYTVQDIVNFVESNRVSIPSF